MAPGQVLPRLRWKPVESCWETSGIMFNNRISCMYIYIYVYVYMYVCMYIYIYLAYTINIHNNVADFIVASSQRHSMDTPRLSKLAILWKLHTGAAVEWPWHGCSGSSQVGLNRFSSLPSKECPLCRSPARHCRDHKITWNMGGWGWINIPLWGTVCKPLYWTWVFLDVGEDTQSA